MGWSLGWRAGNSREIFPRSFRSAGTLEKFQGPHRQVVMRPVSARNVQTGANFGLVTGLAPRKLSRIFAHAASIGKKLSRDFLVRIGRPVVMRPARRVQPGASFGLVPGLAHRKLSRNFPLCGAGPGDLGGSRGSLSAGNPRQTWPGISSQSAFKYPGNVSGCVGSAPYFCKGSCCTPDLPVRCRGSAALQTISKGFMVYAGLDFST